MTQKPRHEQQSQSLWNISNDLVSCCSSLVCTNYKRRDEEEVYRKCGWCDGILMGVQSYKPSFLANSFTTVYMPRQAHHSVTAAAAPCLMQSSTECWEKLHTMFTDWRHFWGFSRQDLQKNPSGRLSTVPTTFWWGKHYCAICHNMSSSRLFI